MLDAALTPAY